MPARSWLFSAVCLFAVACSPTDRGERAPLPPLRSIGTTFEKFYFDAARDDPKAQNLLGYMLYFGEGVEKDPVTAHYWFERAASQNHVTAHLNLAVIYHLGDGAPHDPAAAARAFGRWQSAVNGRSHSPVNGATNIAETIRRIREQKQMAPMPGRKPYEKFCAGCHGVSGIAKYVASPSFAIGERLNKFDAQLLTSIKEGHGVMPAWDYLLTEHDRRSILAYIRSLPKRFENGIALPRRNSIGLYYIFGPTEKYGLPP
jgi:mono/diheme cytochrome c family protein